MNRAERRRQERAEARAARERIPAVFVGEGIVAAELKGHQFQAKGGAQLLPKEPGVHRWIASAAYVLSVEQARTAYDDDRMHVLDHENLMYLGIGCWDCEQPLGVIEVDSYCPAAGDD